MNLQERTDKYTMKCCRFLVKHCQTIPKGETAETLAEIVEAHRAALHVMPQRTGKGTLVLEIGLLAKKYPPELRLASSDATTEFALEGQPSDPREHPDMVAALEIFDGKWL